MGEARERLKAVEKKHQLFKQQQFIFIAALERSREHAHDRTEPVSSVVQVQGYKDLHCSNATDKRIFSLFLEIVGELRAVLELLESSTHSPGGGGVLETCRLLLSPNCNISKLLVHFPHREVHRLSCDEARNYYGGVVSLIPLAHDLLNRLSYSYDRHVLSPAGTPRASPHLDQDQNQHQDQVQDQGAGGAGAAGVGDLSFSKARRALHGSKGLAKRTGGGCWHAGKPAWRPPGRTHR